MIVLYGAGAGFGLPEISPYVIKTEVQLKMLGLPYEKRIAQPSEGPKGQIPFIDDDGVLIGDSTVIRAHLEARTGLDLDEGLSPGERAEAWMIERMVEEHLDPAASYARGIIRETFDKGPARWFDQAPPALRGTLRDDLYGRVSEALRIKGIGRHSPDEIVALATRSLRSLSSVLGDKRYLMGVTPTGTDAAAFGLMAMILTPHFDSPLRRRAEEFQNLVAYTDRMMGRFFQGFPWRRALSPLAA